MHAAFSKPSRRYLPNSGTVQARGAAMFGNSRRFVLWRRVCASAGLRIAECRRRV